MAYIARCYSTSNTFPRYDISVDSYDSALKSCIEDLTWYFYNNSFQLPENLNGDLTLKNLNLIASLHEDAQYEIVPNTDTETESLSSDDEQEQPLQKSYWNPINWIW